MNLSKQIKINDYNKKFYTTGHVR